MCSTRGRTRRGARPPVVLGTVAALLVVAELVAGAPAGATSATSYRVPADAAVVDPFRLGADPYGPGNRGVDLATAPGDEVVAAAGGTVTFAGPVGGRLHVTVLHPDGLRTTYSFLRRVTVSRGDGVAAGDVVGQADGPVHWSARAGDAYLDPLLLVTAPPRVHLAPDAVAFPDEAGERNALERLLAVVGGAAGLAGDVSADALRWAAAAEQVAADAALGAVTQALELGAMATVAIEATLVLRERLDDECTWPDEPAPSPTGRSIVVLVGGLGSSSENAAVWDLEQPLRADGHEVVRFSYAGGSVGERLYGPEHTTQDIRRSGALLRELLARTAAANPGVPVSLVAHSMGGLASRAALADTGGGVPPVRSLVTLGTPHEGADLAGIVTGLRRLPGPGTVLLEAVDRAERLGFDPRTPAVGQMAPGSPLLRELDAAGVPEGVAVTAIGARHDLVVANTRARWSGARNTTVDPGGVVTDHDALPGSPQALLEVRRALGGQLPTCQGFLDHAADVVSGVVVEEVGTAVRHGTGHISRDELFGEIAEEVGGRGGRATADRARARRSRTPSR